MNITAAIAAHVAEVTYQSLDRATIYAVKRLVMDAIAVAIAGTAEEAPRIIAEQVRALESRPKATVWGFGFSTAPQSAAFCNAASMHVLDFEPMSSPPTHAVSPTLPAAFALAEALRAPGREIVAACVKGFEIQGRVLLASSHDRGDLPFHTPGVVGVMGSVVAASHLLHLDATQLAHALGIAASRCSGLSANTGSMVKCTHCGNASSAGVEAALLAKRGFIANPRIFDADRGYVATFFPKHFDADALLAFGRPYRCVDPGMALKFYPSKYPTHFAIAAALEARRQIAGPASIRAVRIFTPGIEDADRPQPRSGLEGKFSFQYTAAAALLDGRVGIDTFTDTRRFADDMVSMLDRIRVIRDPYASRDTRNMRLEIEIDISEGGTVRGICTAPPGSWGLSVDADLHRAKITDCLRVRFDESRISQLLAMVDALDTLSSDQVGELATLLA
jgi:aconitate decarboxylase